MTYSTAGPAPRVRGWAAGVAAAFAGLLLLPGVAHADTPAVTVKPESGGPGTPMTIAGDGFCAKPSCAPVHITISGRRLAADQRPDASGAFRATAQAPGGLTPGEHEIVATQTLDDGNEISATAAFIYSPSKGEAAEREAENRDAVTNLENSNAPAPPTRGVPLESAVAQLTASTDASAPPARTSGSSAGQFSNGDDGVPVVRLMIAASLAALAAGVLWWRRRTLGGVS